MLAKLRCSTLRPSLRALSITVTSRTSGFETTTLPGVDGHARAARTCHVL
jgi:hypothetical protein